MNDDELQALLRGADPAAHLPPAGPARVADLLEDAVSTTRPTPTPAPAPAPAAAAERPGTGRRRRPWAVGLVAAAAAAAVAVVAVPVVRSLAPAPVTTELVAEPYDALALSCPPVAEVLPGVDTAFSGRVSAVDGHRVTLEVERVYRGEPGERVVVEAPHQDEQSAATVGGFPFEVGGEYLVTATGGVVTACGGSGPVDPALQGEYDRAFG